MVSELKRLNVIAGGTPNGAPPTERVSSMIGWTEHREETIDPLDALTWGDVAESSPAPSSLDALEPFLAAADAPTPHDAMRALSDAFAGRWGCDAVVWCVRGSAPDSTREVFVRAASLDDLDTAVELAPVPTDDFDRAVRHCLFANDVITSELPVGDRFCCSVWFVWRDSARGPHQLEATLLRAAGVSLRAVWLTWSLRGAGPRSTVDLVRRDRREAAIGKMLCAAAPEMLAAHAALAASHASLRSELAGLRVLAPQHPSTRACASLLDDAWTSAEAIWGGLSAVASLSDESSPAADAATVIQAVASLIAPYVARRAKVVAAVDPLPLVAVAPAYLAEALVMFVTRVAFQFVEGERERATVRLGATVTARGVEVVVCATARDAPTSQHYDQDLVVGEVFGRDLAMRCGASVDVERDALGATTYHLVVPKA